MASVAARFAGPTLEAPAGTVPAPPRARPSAEKAPAVGEHNAAILGDL
jgi:hypothetical protein